MFNLARRQALRQIPRLSTTPRRTFCLRPRNLTLTVKTIQRGLHTAVDSNAKPQDDHVDAEDAGSIPSRRRRPILTRASFIPKTMLPQDYVDLSNKVIHILPISTSGADNPMLTYYTSETQLGRQVPFPPNAKGFFYLYWPEGPASHPAAAEMRFRVVGQPDPSLFEQGTDLCIANGRPWCIPILVMKIHGIYAGLYNTILSFDEHQRINDFFERAQTHPKNCTTWFSKRTRLATSTAPFEVDFSTQNFRLHILDPDYIALLQINHVFYVQPTFYPGKFDNSICSKYRSPYSGVGLVRFEPVDFEILGGRIRRKVAMRLLQWLQPPNPTNKYVQEEGELVKKFDLVTQTERPWVSKSSNFLPQASLDRLNAAFPVVETIQKDISFVPRAKGHS